MAISINIAVEDDLSHAVLAEMLKQTRRGFEVAVCYKQNGYGYLKRNLPAFLRASSIKPFIILADLDVNPCAATLADSWLGQSANLPQTALFRVAVKEVESWVLADPKSLAGFMGVREKEFPANPDQLDDPKDFIVQVARKSRYPVIQNSMVPAAGSRANVGPYFTRTLVQFVRNHWEAAKAQSHSDSFRRAWNAVNNFNTN